MRIDTNNRTTGVNRNGAARSASGTAFVPTGAETPTQIASAAPLAATAGIESILALQAVDNALEGKRKVVQRGNSMLDTLDEIKADLLVGRISFDRLDRTQHHAGRDARTLPAGPRCGS